MKKSFFILWFFVGTLCLWLFLPLYNYNVDQWRVLHKDYKHAYLGIKANKAFLKVSYLIDNPQKYDTILMGSSRNSAINANNISLKTYNIDSPFNILDTNLQNLQNLLKNDVKIKNIWLAINDYDIWKDPKSFEKDWQKKIYPYSFFEKLKFYYFYLFKGIDNRDISVWKNDFFLREVTNITNNPSPSYIEKIEKTITRNPESWKKKMTSSAGSLLGYSGTSHRIDKAIHALKEIKLLCDQHNISLTVFMYPSFYKTYLLYNQEKIIEFKQEIVKITPFHDFYNLNELSLNELNWFDTSHFNYNIGNYIIKSIQDNTFLVTEDTIDKHILEDKKKIQNLVDKILPIKYIYPFSTTIDISFLRAIYILKNKTTKIILDKIISDTENVLAALEIESDEGTILTVYYKTKPDSSYTKKNIFIRHIKKGISKYSLSIPSSYLKNGIKFEFSNQKISSKINTLILYQ